jgi:hypothetical protein
LFLRKKYNSYNVRNISINLYMKLKHYSPVAVAELSEAWAIFDRSEAVNVGSNPAMGMDV